MQEILTVDQMFSLMRGGTVRAGSGEIQGEGRLIPRQDAQDWSCADADNRHVRFLVASTSSVNA